MTLIQITTKKGFVKLLTSRPDVVRYIRKLSYKVKIECDGPPTHLNLDDHLLSPILPNFLRTISRLNFLKITNLHESHLDWNKLDSFLKSVFLHLMHLPTINHIYLSYIQKFPLSSLIPLVNLHQLDIYDLRLEEDHDGSPEIVVQLEMMPKIRDLHVLESSLLTTKLLHAKTQDGRLAFNFMGLRRLSISFNQFEDEQNIRYILQNAKLLEGLHITLRQSLVGLLSPSLSARTLKVLDFIVFLFRSESVSILAGLCGELEAMAELNMLEVLSFGVYVGADNTEDLVGSMIQKVENVVIRWSALRRVRFDVSIVGGYNAKLSEALQSLPDKYLLSKFVAFDYSVLASTISIV